MIVDTLAGQDVIPSPNGARTGVREFGRAVAVAYGGTVYFYNLPDNRVYSTEPVTPGERILVHPFSGELLTCWT